MMLTEEFKNILNTKANSIWKDAEISELILSLSEKIYTALVEKACEIDDSEKTPLALKIRAYRTENGGISEAELQLIHISLLQQVQLLSLAKDTDEKERYLKIKNYILGTICNLWPIDDQSATLLAEFGTATILLMLKNGVNINLSESITPIGISSITVSQYYGLFSKVLNTTNMANALSPIEAICLVQALITSVAEEKE